MIWRELEPVLGFIGALRRLKETIIRQWGRISVVFGLNLGLGMTKFS